MVGVSYIRIADDGKGISREDLELSFERHATSKIRTADDLNEVKSMGFRGEALASIAAVAKVEMISKTANADTGSKIVIEGGDIREISDAGAPTGTTITVQELFFNTPVRYKFLKKDYTEAGYIEDVITRLALVNPDISFKFINSGKTIIQTRGDGNIKNVIYSIYGKAVASNCLNVNAEYDGINITGVIGKPEIARSNRANQIFFVNKRYVRDRVLSGATEKAFKGMIPIGKFGFLVLNLEMTPSLVDSNVHPAKLEVRFQEEQKVFKAVYCAIQDTLLKAELIANSDIGVSGIRKGEDMEEEQETKSSLTGLFRKIAKNADSDSNNLIESIYKSKNGGHDIEEIDKFEEDTIKEEVKHESVNSILKVTEDKEIQDDKIGNSPLQTNNISISNEEAIKKTLNELMQMGKSLTAEQIREKIAKVAQEQNISKQVSNEENIKDEEKISKIKVETENMPEWKRMLYEKRQKNTNSNLNGNIGYTESYYQRTNTESTISDTYKNATTIGNKASASISDKKDIFDETFSNFTLVPSKQLDDSVFATNNIEPNRNMLNFEEQSNKILEKNEDYKTKEGKFYK